MKFASHIDALQGTLYFGWFIGLSSITRILIITVSLGLLGSVLRVTRYFFEDDRDNKGEAWPWYVLRPFLGAITALAILMLVKAGQLTISNTSVGAEGSELNPFLVAFLAIVSGFLSVQAHDRIYVAGSTLFGNRTDPQNRDRYLREFPKLEKLTIKRLAELLDVRQDKVEDWFSLESPVPHKYQRAIATWLDDSERTLFTDVYPSKVERENARNDLELSRGDAENKVS